MHDGDNIIITPTDNFHGTNPGIDKVEVRIKRSFTGGRLFMRLDVTSPERVAAAWACDPLGNAVVFRMKP